MSNDETPIPGESVRLLQIREDDLTNMTRDVVLLCEEMAPHMKKRHRTMLRRIQRVLTDVLWNYQPHTDHELIDHDDVERELG